VPPAAPRRPQLEQYWEALEPAVQAAAAADASVAQILRDLRLDALLRAVAFGEQVFPRQPGLSECVLSLALAA